MVAGVRYNNRVMPFGFFCNFLILVACIVMITSGILDKRQHQTNASLERMNDLKCFECNSMVVGEECSNLTLHNLSKFHQRCKGDRKTCMVKRYSYTMSLEGTKSEMQMWSINRSCTKVCEDGCIVIGERTKLYACNACCTTNLCNISNHASCFAGPSYHFIFLLLIIYLL